MEEGSTPRERTRVHVTGDGVQIFVSRGEKSPFDFKVQYRQPGKRLRTPKHIHLIVDLYMKLTGNRKLTMQLIDHIIYNIILKVKPITSFPPNLQIFSDEHVHRFQELECYGEYSIEFLLVVMELIQIQEKTNYPNGTFNLNLFRKFRQGADIFEVVSAATFTG
jgi:hypothetical protein